MSILLIPAWKELSKNMKKHSYVENHLAANYEPKENWSLEHPKLLAQIELLQRNIRNYMGEDLDPLSLRELQSLQQKLDNALKRIQTKKNQLMLESISQLQKKEKSLQDQNKLLAKKLKEREKQQIAICGESQQPLTGADEGGSRALPADSNNLIPPWLLRQ